MRATTLPIITLMLCCYFTTVAQDNLPANFPQYKDTGDREADHAVYDKAKMAWVEANPQAYKKVGGQINEPPTPALDSELNDVAYEPDRCKEAEESPPKIPANCTVWELTDATALDQHKQLKTSELQQLQTEIQEEFLSEKIYWKISPKGTLYIFYNDKYNGHYQYERKKDHLILLPYELTECNKGAKTFPIEKWNGTQLIINMPDQDEGSMIVYQLSFTKAS